MYKRQNLPQGVKSLVFIFAIIGFGTKAGIIPLHTWIPRAYPVAPSNITPLMSAVMIKTAVYGFLRIALDVLGPGPEWWGITVIVIGAVSAVLGILYAVMENDLKVFLAYSSVENVGIMLLGIGAAMVRCAVRVAVFAAALHFQMQDFATRSTAPFIRYQIVSAMLMVGRLGAEAVGAVGLASQILGAVRAGIAAVGTGTVALVGLPTPAAADPAGAARAILEQIELACLPDTAAQR